MLGTPEGGTQPRERRWTGRRSGTDRRRFDRRLFDRRQDTVPAAIERRQAPRRQPGLELSLELVREAEQLEAPLRTRLIDQLARAAQGIRGATGMWRTRPTEVRKFQ